MHGARSLARKPHKPVILIVCNCKRWSLLQVERIRMVMEPWEFERLYGAFAWCDKGGSAIVQKSAKRYIGFLDGTEKRAYF